MAPVKIVWTRDGQAPARVQTFCFPQVLLKRLLLDTAGAGETAGAAGALRDAWPMSAAGRVHRRDL